ncbi:MAG TPA: hypothetical protein VNN79_19860 [Actinomycetota bacterium]|nr:hypothetical protein [Actinomycetota bacterium]
MFIPFGDVPSQAGALLKKKFASQPLVPPSFAIDYDGSLWLLDLVKHRISHYGANGEFIGATGGLEFSRFRPYAQDLAFVDGQLYVAEFTHNTLQTYVRTVSADGLGSRVRVESNGRPIFISRLASPTTELIGYASGASGVVGRPPTAGFHGYWVIDPDTGASRGTKGIPLADGSRLGTGGTLINNGRSLLVVHKTDTGLFERTIHLVVRPSAQSNVRIPVVAGWQTSVALPHGFATYAGFAPSRLADDQRYHGAERWLLEYFDDGQPLVWEPLPESPLDGAYVWRYLTEGLDGHLYLMLAERGGMRIYRRPGPPAS